MCPVDPAARPAPRDGVKTAPARSGPRGRLGRVAVGPRTQYPNAAFRHSSATHLLEARHDFRTVHELLSTVMSAPPRPTPPRPQPRSLRRREPGGPDRRLMRLARYAPLRRIHHRPRPSCLQDLAYFLSEVWWADWESREPQDDASTSGGAEADGVATQFPVTGPSVLLAIDCC